jgi:hypothetical protein
LIISAVKSEVAEVKADTAQIPSIKQDTSQIEGLVQQIGLLRVQLENIHMNDAKARHLQMFLDQSTTYAETVMDSIHEEVGKPYATDGSESDESENEQQVPTTIDSTESMVTRKISSSPEQPNHTLSVGTFHLDLSSTASNRTDGVGLGPPDMIYDVTVPDSVQQALPQPLLPLNHNATVAYATFDDDDDDFVYYGYFTRNATQHSHSETSDQPPPVRDYAAQSTTNTNALSRNGTTAVATENLKPSRASRQPAKAPGHYPRKPVALSSDAHVLLPSRDKEAIKKATLLRDAMSQKKRDRLHKSLEDVIRGRKSLTDSFRIGPWFVKEPEWFPSEIWELLDRGADPNRLSDGYDLCTIAMEEGCRRLPVLVLLLMRGASFQPSAAGPWLVEAIRSDDWGFCLKGYSEVKEALVTDLLDLGVSPNAKNERGTSALSYACRLKYPTYVKLLLDRGAVADNAALKTAAEADRIDNVKMLLGHKTTSISSSGISSAIAKAAGNQRRMVRDILEKHEASLTVHTPRVHTVIENPAIIARLVGMGWSRDESRKALEKFNYDFERV